jgi:hypothetical protein
MRSTRLLILSLILVLSCCGTAPPKVDLFDNDPDHNGFQWRHIDGSQEHLDYHDARVKDLHIEGSTNAGLNQLIVYYENEIKLWKDKAQSCPH